MKALSKIPTFQLKFPNSNEFYTLLGAYYDELFNLLQKQDRTLKISALEVMKMILGIFEANLPTNLQKSIVSNISTFVSDEDFYLAQLSMDLLILIININPTRSAEYDQVIQNSVTLCRSSLIQSQSVDKLK
mmetsp:Transcript_25555/g.22583  ORF Transcript_25555/g.22583 Transcript_25555/m.22583 type:complete len:132 (+) Transcript_25555:1978-2373(+)